MRVQAEILLPVFLALIVLALLSGCGSKQALPLLSREPSRARPPAASLDPEGPIPAPNLPPELARQTAPAQAAPARGVPVLGALPLPGLSRSSTAEQGNAIAYDVRCEVRDPGQTGEDQSKRDDLLVSAFTGSSILFKLQDSPPDTLIGLERRLSVALGEAREVLHGNGYYSGKAQGSVIPPAPGGSGGSGSDARAEVRILFFPGPLYRIGKSAIDAPLPATLVQDAPDSLKRLPRTLADVGLAPDAPAVAADVLAAVDRVRDAYLENGFPFAVITSTRYIVDHSQRTLDAELRVAPGAFVRMGALEYQGTIPVTDHYLQSMRTWDEGRPWQQSRVESLRESLRRSGLFQSIDLNPGEKEDAAGTRPVLVALEGAPERTISGALKYHSDFGPGVQGNWRHRNLTGRGDSLRVSLPLWMDMQELTATYRLPFFLRRDQDLIANAGLLHQDTDAYRLSSGAASGGIERRLSRRWSGSVQGSVEGGTIKEPDQPSRDYIMYGLPLGLIYNNTDSLLNATRGQRLLLSFTPFTGEFEGNFSVLRSRLEGQIFLPLAGEDTLVLALRGVVGAVSGQDSDRLPPSIRFYSGGGGSVRGYEFQSLGPRNEDRKPLGGGSLLEVNTEARWRITPEWGMVAFVDGGTAYENVFDDPNQPLRWGAGLGLRYYTAIGPVRFDVATPLNPRKDDDPLQFYISIGQSF